MMMIKKRLKKMFHFYTLRDGLSKREIGIVKNGTAFVSGILLQIKVLYFYK